MSEKKQKHVPAFLAGMLVLGTIGLCFVGWLFEHRTDQPVVAGDTPPVETSAHGPRQLLAVGAARSIAHAARLLADERRSRAVHAMDAGERATQLAVHVTSGDDRKAFEQALQIIKDGRHALQMGEPLQAATHFTRAAELLDDLQPDGQGTSPARSKWSAYEGAQLLNAYGARIGELERLQEDDSGRAEAVLRLGGMQDFLGFVDLGGREIVVPADGLLYGKPTKLGSTMTALPVFGDGAARLTSP